MDIWNKLKNISLTVFAVFFSFTSAQADDSVKPTLITASYFQHPAMPPFITFLKEVYAEHDIKLEAIPMPASRGIIELNRGLVQADIVRPKAFVQDFKNIIVLNPAIYDGEVVLLCSKQVTCSKRVLNDSNASILATQAVQSTIKNHTINAQLINYEDLIKTLNMLTSERIDYVIYGTTRKFKKELSKKYQVVDLQKVQLHHVLNKEYQHLVPLIESSIKKNLPHFNVDY